MRAQINRGDVSEEELAQRREKAMADPNIQNILTDPVMRQAGLTCPACRIWQLYPSIACHVMSALRFWPSWHVPLT